MEDALIAVYGAGSVGCYLGGRLLASGARVRLVARPAIAHELRAHGLELSDYRGAQMRVAPSNVSVSSDPEAAREASLVLVTVKS